MPDRTVGASLTRGYKKKERTRRLLLQNALEVVAERGDAFSISDISSRAGVSQGTFYNYFADREALMTALVDDILERFTAESAAATTEEDPALRFALITARALEQVAAAPELARVALRLEPVQRSLMGGGPFAYLRDDLVAGHASGRFVVRPDNATFDVVIGSILIAARRIVDGDGDRSYRSGVIQRVLVALGIDDDEAGRIATQAVSS